MTVSLPLKPSVHFSLLMLEADHVRVIIGYGHEPLNTACLTLSLVLVRADPVLLP
jgi:hypothetical protein